MPLAATVAQDVTAAAFAALGLAITYRWYQERRPTQAMLAGALDSIGIVAVLGRIGAVYPSPALSVITVVAFIAAAYFVFLFRNEYIPVGRNTQLAALVLVAVSIVVGVVMVTVLQRAPRWLTTVFLLEFVVAWTILIGEPIVRFWLASNTLPAVQQMRMRFLSFGFGVWIVVVLIASLAGSAVQGPLATILTQLLALATVPLIYISFSPPTLLRRIWRMGEETAMRAAMQDLLIFSPSRQVLAERAISWAVRLTGASAGFVVDSDGTVMAAVGVSDERAAELAASTAASTSDSAGGGLISAPLQLTEGQGQLAVIAGPFTPLFGSEEVLQLNSYATSVTAGLERARVTERMAAIEKNKTQFLNLASHELRGPVTVIRGYVSMLEGGMLGALNDRGRKAAAVMAAKVSEMNELIEEMIDAARLEEGGLTLRSVESDLREIARQAAEVVAPMTDGHHNIVMDLPDRSIRVMVDPERTKTIVTNLLSNAIKYSPDGGQITTVVRSRGGTARISVTDEGLGIAPENFPTLFTRFGRVVTPETEHLKGTGLGLFLSRQLARLQGGDITVVSEPRKGSTFTLHLPVAARHDSQALDVEENSTPEQVTAQQSGRESE